MPVDVEKSIVPVPKVMVRLGSDGRCKKIESMVSKIVFFLKSCLLLRRIFVHFSEKEIPFPEE